MPKNLTLSIPDELAREMENWREVNWSEVARTSIQTYIERRKKPDLANLLQNLDAQKGDEYVKGVEFVKMLAKTRGYAAVSVVMGEYNKLLAPLIDDATKEGRALGALEDWDEATSENVSVRKRNACVVQAMKNAGVFSGAASEAWSNGARVTLEEIARLLEEK